MALTYSCCFFHFSFTILLTDYFLGMQVEPSKRQAVDTTESTDSERPTLIAHYLYIQVRAHQLGCDTTDSPLEGPVGLMK